MSIKDKLVPMLIAEELHNALLSLPAYDDCIKDGSPSERLMALSDLYKVYVPNSMSYEVYSKLYLSILHSISKKESMDAVLQSNINVKQIRGAIADGVLGGADSFTIIGTSGIGKSSAINHSINLIIKEPIIHTVSAEIIPCLVVQTPFDSSVKGLLLAILLRVDEVLGSTYYDNALKAHATVDMLVGTVSNVCIRHVCLLVCDEVQNLANSRNGKALVGVLTQLINNSGISIAFVGTPASAPFFEQALHLARRTVGLKYGPMQYDDDFKNLCGQLWEYQYTKEKVEMTDSILIWLYEHSAGLISILISLVHDAQEIAILDGTEKLNLEVLEKAYNTRLSMLHGYINPIMHRKINGSASKKKEVASDYTAILQQATDLEVSISDIVRIAKSQGKNVVKMVAEKYLVEEVKIH